MCLGKCRIGKRHQQMYQFFFSFIAFRRHSDRPAITQAPRDLNVRPGEKVEISFNIRGEPGQEVIWFKDGQRISESDTYRVSSVFTDK